MGQRLRRLEPLSGDVHLHLHARRPLKTGGLRSQENILNRPCGCFNLPCLIVDFVLLLGVIDSCWHELDLKVEVSPPWHP